MPADYELDTKLFNGGEPAAPRPERLNHIGDHWTRAISDHVDGFAINEGVWEAMDSFRERIEAELVSQMSKDEEELLFDFLAQAQSELSAGLGYCMNNAACELKQSVSDFFADFATEKNKTAFSDKN